MQILTRVRYNFWMLLADVGGFHDGLRLLVSFLLAPITAIFFENDMLRSNLFEESLTYKQKQQRRELAKSLNEPMP